MQAFLLKVQVLTLICLIFFAVSKLSNKPEAIAEELIPNKITIPYTSLNSHAQREMVCLAENIYFEARNEPIEGMYAVAFVTMNRVQSGLFPNTICDVVKQKTRVESIGNSKVVCQFSWYCEPKPKHISQNRLLTKDTNQVYNEILRLSIFFYANYERMRDPTMGALFYHADYVNPRWKNVQKTVQIGRHIFYQDKGNQSDITS
jgi:spore germination cell wall hydrolase CwlJ-like protein